MGPRIYPSYQDTNTTAKGSLIMSMDVNVDYIDIYINNIFRQRQYSVIQNLYSIELSVGDVVRLERPVNFSIDLNRTDYTTDDTNGNNGIVNTHITGVSNTNTYTFTAQTLSNDYNFEYDISIGEAFGPTGYKATMIFTFISRVNTNGNTVTINPTEYYLYGQQNDTIPPFDINVFAFYPTPIPFTGSTTYSQNLGYFPLLQETNNEFNALLRSQMCYDSLSSGTLLQGRDYSYFKIYVNGNLVSTATYFVTDNGFGVVNPCSITPVSLTSVNGTFICNDGDIVEYVFDDSFVVQSFTPTPLPTNTPTPTPTVTNTPTPTTTPIPIPYEGQYMLAVKSDNLVYKSNDFGTTWTQVSGFTTGMTVTDTAISQTGQYQVISTYNGPLYVSNNYGVSFTSVGTNDTYTDVAISSTGQYISAITDTLATRKLVQSVNYGVSFNLAFSLIGQTPSDLAIDDNGNSYISWRNGVQKYTRSTATMAQLYNNTTLTNWSSVTVSGDGLYVVTSRGSLIQYSTNGTTFNAANSVNNNIVNLISSRDGIYVQSYGTVSFAPTSTKSSNSGANWVSNAAVGYPAISEKGKYQGNAYLDDIKISSDYGLSYTTVFTLTNASWKNLSINR